MMIHIIVSTDLKQVYLFSAYKKQVLGNALSI